MKNKKKIVYKNRVKCFYTEPENYGRNRLKNDEGSLDAREGEENDLKNQEEEGDFS